jgi:hypothetical protein
MLSRLKNSLAFRSGNFYKPLLSILPPPAVTSKTELPVTFLTLCGAKHLGQLQECLYSLYHAWSSLPKLQVVSDGSIGVSGFEKALSWWPGEKTIYLPADYIQYHLNLGREYLAKFAENNIMGLKLAAVLKAAEKEPTIYCDTDILWFRDLPSSISKETSSSKVTLKMSEDFQAAYDGDLVTNQSLNHLYNPTFFCAGLVFLNGQLLEVLDLENLFVAAAKKSNHFTEQTIFAEANYRLNRDFWSREKIACFVEDQFSLAPTFIEQNWIARHYVGPVRHLFWRDALALRLGLRQKQIQEIKK